jgi:hypothetical protein
MITGREATCIRTRIGLEAPHCRAHLRHQPIAESAIRDGDSCSADTNPRVGLQGSIVDATVQQSAHQSTSEPSHARNKSSGSRALNPTSCGHPSSFRSHAMSSTNPQSSAIPIAHSSNHSRMISSKNITSEITVHRQQLCAHPVFRVRDRDLHGRRPIRCCHGQIALAAEAVDEAGHS